MDSKKEDYRSPKARAMHDFIMHHINGNPFNPSHWNKGYNSTHGYRVAGWKQAFHSPPETPPVNYLSSIYQLLEDCSQPPITREKFEWMRETGTAGHTFLMAICNVTYHKHVKDAQNPDPPKAEKIILELLEAILSQKACTKYSAFREVFSEVIAAITDPAKFTLLQHAAITKNPELFDRVIGLYQEYNPKALKLHIGNVTKDGFTLLQNAAITGNEGIILKTCSLYREHLPKQEQEENLIARNISDFNLLHNLLRWKPGNDTAENSRESIIAVFRLYVHTLGDERARAMIDGQLQEYNTFRTQPAHAQYIDSVFRLFDEAVRREKRRLITEAAQTGDTAETRRKAYIQLWKSEHQRGSNVSKDS